MTFDDQRERGEILSAFLFLHYLRHVPFFTYQNMLFSTAGTTLTEFLPVSEPAIS
jgi:hypothetical protein